MIGHTSCKTFSYLLENTEVLRHVYDDGCDDAFELVSRKTQ